MVTYKEIISAVVSMDNSADSAAQYAISCQTHVQNNRVNSVQMGQVKKEGNHIANFDSVEGNLNIYFFSQAQEERTAVLEAVQAFVEEVKAYVNDNPIVKQ